MTEAIFTAILGTLTAAISVMWKSMKSDHGELVKICQRQDEALAKLEKEQTVYRTCAAKECPARAAMKILNTPT